MPNVAVGQRLLMTIVGRYLGQTTMNTFLYRCSATGAGISDITAIDALDTKLKSTGDLFSKYSACMPGVDDWLGLEIWYQLIAPTRYRKVQRPWVAMAQGDYVSGVANVQGSIERYGELASRKAIGGIRLPLSSGACEFGLLNDVVKGTYDVLAAVLDDNQSTASPSVVWVPQVGLPGYTPGDPPIPGNPMNSIDCVGAIAKGEARVLRRRTVGLGI